MDSPRFRWGRPRDGTGYEPATDARLADDEPARDGQVDPDRQRRKRMRRGVLVLCLVAVFLAGSLIALVGRGGYVDLHRKSEEARKLREEVATLRVNVGVLDHVVRRLETEPVERERIAREQIGLILPGEVDFLLPRSDVRDPAARAADAPRAESGGVSD